MSTSAFCKLVQRIREELADAPDFRMSVSEAARFWGLDLELCRQVLAQLRLIGVVSRDSEWRYYASGGEQFA